MEAGILGLDMDNTKNCMNKRNFYSVKYLGNKNHYTFRNFIAKRVEIHAAQEGLAHKNPQRFKPLLEHEKVSFVNANIVLGTLYF